MAKEKQGEQREPTPEEREVARTVAMKNLQAKNLGGLAVAYMVNKDKGQFGEYDNSAVEQYKYFPAISSGAKYTDPTTGQEVDLMVNSLLGSRDDGERYSGQVSEKAIMKKANEIVSASLYGVKVEDILQLAGSKVPIDSKYRGKYIANLLESKDKETQEFVQTLVALYNGYFVSKNVGEAINQRTASAKSGLEQLVKPEEKKK